MPAKTKEDETPEVVDRTRVVTANGRPVAVVAPMDYVQSEYDNVLQYARNVIDETDLTIRPSQDESRVLFSGDEELAISVDAVQTQK